jgi:hypothetical protein
MSTSSIVYEFLSEQEKGYTFTVQELFDTLVAVHPEVTHGGVSGFCSRNRQLGHLSVAVVDGVYHYSVLNMNGVKVKKAAGAGGAEGRRLRTREHKLRPITVQSVQDRPIELAAELEKARTP